ncbi:hypothetical protein HK099_007341 [Clydaea vesicula]|uniref:Uncharacterized protein n=1 Tax=Clydaea vesicula TaxID=447962 RepID=A0AAD5U731_9FUNG|nr:hypothetical protein HK099_007341 [Clydaea vesicula]
MFGIFVKTINCEKLKEGLPITDRRISLELKNQPQNNVFLTEKLENNDEILENIFDKTLIYNRNFIHIIFNLEIDISSEDVKVPNFPPVFSVFQGSTPVLTNSSTSGEIHRTSENVYTNQSASSSNANLVTLSGSTQNSLAHLPVINLNDPPSYEQLPPTPIPKPSNSKNFFKKYKILLIVSVIFLLIIITLIIVVVVLMVDKSSNTSNSNSVSTESTIPVATTAVIPGNPVPSPTPAANSKIHIRSGVTLNGKNQCIYSAVISSLNTLQMGVCDDVTLNRNNIWEMQNDTLYIHDESGKRTNLCMDIPNGDMEKPLVLVRFATTLLAVFWHLDSATRSIKNKGPYDGCVSVNSTTKFLQYVDCKYTTDGIAVLDQVKKEILNKAIPIHDWGVKCSKPEEEVKNKNKNAFEIEEVISINKAKLQQKKENLRLFKETEKDRVKEIFFTKKQILKEISKKIDEESTKRHTRCHVHRVDNEQKKLLQRTLSKDEINISELPKISKIKLRSYMVYPDEQYHPHQHLNFADDDKYLFVDYKDFRGNISNKPDSDFERDLRIYESRNYVDELKKKQVGKILYKTHKFYAQKERDLVKLKKEKEKAVNLKKKTEHKQDKNHLVVRNEVVDEEKKQKSIFDLGEVSYDASKYQ